MNKDLALSEVFSYRTGFKPIYQVQERCRKQFGEGWRNEWVTMEQFETMQECLDSIATYHPEWFEKNQVRITELATSITVKATAPLPVTYARKLEEEKK
jgi:hypothetical protein